MNITKFPEQDKVVYLLDLADNWKVNKIKFDRRNNNHISYFNRGLLFDDLHSLYTRRKEFFNLSDKVEKVDYLCSWEK